MIQGTSENIIQQSIDSIEIEPELLTLERIDETINTINYVRNERIEEMFDRINLLKKKKNDLSAEVESICKVNNYSFEIIEELKSIQTDNFKFSEINKDDNIFDIMDKKFSELDNLKLMTAENLTYLENSVNTISLTKTDLIKNLERVKEKIETSFNIVKPVENCDENNNESFVYKNSIILKINIYKSLGISIENFENDDKYSNVKTPNTSGDKIIIFNEKSNYSHILNINKNLTKHFISNYIWEML